MAEMGRFAKQLAELVVLQFKLDELEEREREAARNKIETRSQKRAPKNYFSKQYALELPKGALFYPCCGNDTYEPLELFIDHIRDFYFADVKEIKLPPRFRKKSKEYDSIIDARADDYKNYTNGTELNTLTIFAHQIDAVESLRSIKDIAVFYYRGDYVGEGGSDLLWLDSELFDQVLARMLDGAIVVTDGSNVLPENKMPWRDFWLKKYLPENFVYKDFKINYIGEVERPLALPSKLAQKLTAWQVFRKNSQIRK